MGRKLNVLIIVLVVFLVGCNKEEYTKPEVKRQDPEVIKEDFKFSDALGALDDPVYYGETLFVSGEMYKNKNETFLGEFGVEIDKLYRGDAAKYRLPNEFLDKKLKKGTEWMVVTMNIYNFYDKEDTPLDFNKGDIAIYNGKGKPLTVYDIKSEELPWNVSIYRGREKKVILPVIVDKKSKKFYVGIDKLVREFSIDDLDEDGNLIEIEEEDSWEIVDGDNKEVEVVEKGKKAKKEDKEDEIVNLVKYISLEDMEPIEEFYDEEELEELIEGKK